MSKVTPKIPKFCSGLAIMGSVRVGRIVEIRADFRVLVDYPGNPLGPIAARSVLTVQSDEDAKRLSNAAVLLVFADNDPALPIIIGTVHDQIVHQHSDRPTTIIKGETQDVYLDGERLFLDAEKEIVLRCGQGIITLRRDGKIVLKGVDIVTRASRANKIKGASVNIN